MSESQDWCIDFEFKPGETTSQVVTGQPFLLEKLVVAPGGVEVAELRAGEQVLSLSRKVVVYDYCEYVTEERTTGSSPAMAATEFVLTLKDYVLPEGFRFVCATAFGSLRWKS